MSFGKNPWKRTKLDSVCDAVDGYHRVKNTLVPNETKHTPQGVEAPTPKKAPAIGEVHRVRNLVLPGK